MAAVSKVFDYVVPRSWTHWVEVGTRVRVTLAGRRVGGWVVGDDVTPPAGVTVAPLAGWVRVGATPIGGRVGPMGRLALGRTGDQFFADRLSAPCRADLADTSRSGSHSWAGRTAAERLLGALTQRAQEAEGPVVLRLAPTQDLIDVVTTMAVDLGERAQKGSLLVLVPSLGWAERLAARLAARGFSATTTWEQARAGWPIVVGSRAAAWAPIPNLAAALVLDAHDEAYREESAPTYSAVDVVAERATRAACPFICTSPAPPVTLSEGRTTLALDRAAERAGWAHLEVVDRRGADPRSGLFSEEFVVLARSVLDETQRTARHAPLVCVFNRTGRALLLACRRCGELAQCTNCGAAVRQGEAGFECPRCAERRPVVCAACGHLRMKTLRTGVSRLPRGDRGVARG